MNKVQKLFHKLLGISVSNNEAKLLYNTPIASAGDSGLSDTYLFDFRNYGSTNENYISLEALSSQAGEKEIEDEKPLKIKIKPIEILDELERTPTAFSMFNIDDKIYMLKEKSKLITQLYAKREMVALIERLENRKKYEEFKDFFDRFDNTTDEKIDKLVSKYDVVMKGADIFIPEFPDFAIKIMTEYTETVEKICDKKPVFYVIAEDSKFKKTYERRDPILLVQSPFGFFWQIIGAYDSELLLLSEL